jgi:hypothetical protein
MALFNGPLQNPVWTQAGLLSREDRRGRVALLSFDRHSPLLEGGRT